MDAAVERGRMAHRALGIPARGHAVTRARSSGGDMVTTTAAKAWAVLETVPDPEIPALSVVDLGIVREVVESADGREVTVTLTPTYSGCPATEGTARDVPTALESSYDAVDVVTSLSPAWTTDWMRESA